VRPTRRDLDAAKTVLYEFLERLDIAKIVASPETEPIRQQATEMFDRNDLSEAIATNGSESGLETYLDRIGPQLDAAYDQVVKVLDANLEGFRDGLAAAIDDMTSTWNPEAASDIHTRYNGFPLFDALVYPLRRISDVGELQPINVVRMSPEEATALSTEGAAKLEGVKLHHFGAFFNREGRERDYLWGRLDTAERLIDLLLGDQTSHVTTAAKAILTEEEPNLAHIGHFINNLRAQLETTPTPNPQ
jgi:hypothetical protein